uniref:Uncharacterized protein n=1 Tax=Cuerna arida TaxID=1464854 RepID=A0A1B6G0T7_9HEMI
MKVNHSKIQHYRGAKRLSRYWNTRKQNQNWLRWFKNCQKKLEPLLSFNAPRMKVCRRKIISVMLGLAAGLIFGHLLLPNLLYRFAKTSSSTLDLSEIRMSEHSPLEEYHKVCDLQTRTWWRESLRGEYECCVV